MPSPLEFCASQIAPPGSHLHYQLLFTAETHRPAIYALEYLYFKITQISRRHQEPEVAFESLNFWRQEVANSSSGSPSHPAAQLAKTTVTRHIHSQQFLETIDSDLQFSQLEDVDAFNQYGLARYSWLLENTVPGITESLRQKLTRVLYCQEIATHFIEDFHLAVWYLPLDVCKKHNLLGRKQLDTNLIHDFAVAILEMNAHALKDLKAALKNKDTNDLSETYLHYIFTKIAFAEAMLMVMQKKPERYLAQQPLFSPIYAFYLTCRCRLQLNK